MHNLNLEVIKTNRLTGKILKIDFKVLNPDNFHFLPGQHINIIAGSNLVRPYTLCSDPRHTEIVSIVVSAGHDGQGAKFLKKLKSGDKTKALGPVGLNILKKPLKDNLLFFATGSGIAPFMAMFHTLKSEKAAKNIKLYFGLRNEKSIFFETKLKEFKRTLPFFDYNIVLSRPTDKWDGLKGHVTDYLEIPDPKNTQVYACGVKNMVSDLKHKSEKLGLPKSNLIG